MSKKGLPLGVQMRHDSHYVDIISTSSRSIGRNIAIDLIEPNPEQPRTEIGDLTELSASIKEKGVLEPLLVKPNRLTGRWMIIAGERRWRSAKLAGLTEVPCIEMDLDEGAIAEIALIENLQRKDLNVWEEADGLAALAEKFNYTQEQIAKKISKSRTTVTEFMTIAGIPNELRDRCRAAGLNSKAALLELARQFDEAAMSVYLDDLEAGRKTSKHSRRVKSEDRQTEHSATITNPSLENFTFNSENGRFTLKLSFTKGEMLNRKSVLEALKETFDRVKGGDAGI